MELSDVNSDLYRRSRTVGGKNDIRKLIEQALNLPLCLFNEEANYFYISVTKAIFFTHIKNISTKSRMAPKMLIFSLISSLANLFNTFCKFPPNSIMYLAQFVLFNAKFNTHSVVRLKTTAAYL